MTKNIQIPIDMFHLDKGFRHINETDQATPSLNADSIITVKNDAGQVKIELWYEPIPKLISTIHPESVPQLSEINHSDVIMIDRIDAISKLDYCARKIGINVLRNTISKKINCE